MIKDEYFEGDYRRKPSQNFSGATRNQKIIEFIDKIKHERKKRETSKAEVEKAILLQAIFRGQACRKHIKCQMKNELSNTISELKRKDLRKIDLDLNDICYLIRHLIVIYPRKSLSITGILENADCDNIKYIADIVSKYRRAVRLVVWTDLDWKWRIIFLLNLYMDFIKSPQNSFDETILTFLDTMKCFIDPTINKESMQSYDNVQVATKIIEKLLSKGLFRNLIMILEKISTIPCNSVISLTSHTYDLFKSIFQTMSRTTNVNFLNVSLKLLAVEILCKDLSSETKRLVFGSFKEIETFPIIPLFEIYNTKDIGLFSIHTLHNILVYFETENIWRTIKEQRAYFQLLSKLTIVIPLLGSSVHKGDEQTDEFFSGRDDKEQCVLNHCLNLINNPERTKKWNSALLAMIKRKDNDSLFWFCKCLYHLWLHDSSPVYKHKLIKKIAFQPTFLKALWNYINQQKRILSFSSQLLSVPVLSMLSAGVFITEEEADRVIPTLTMFCFLLKNYIALSSDETLFNEDLFQETGHPFAFTLNDIFSISSAFKEVTIGIISLAFPSISNDGTEQKLGLSTPTQHPELNTLEWKTLLEQIVSLLKSLYDRDCRLQFINDPSFWLSSAMQNSNQLLPQLKEIENISLFSSNLFSSVSQNTIKPFTVAECRYLTVIKNLPFTVNFLERFSIYQKHIAEDKREFQDTHWHFLNTSNITLGIRRDFLYEDTFQKLLLEPELKRLIRVNLTSTVGVEEQGIDGGGLFREFILEFLKTAFDPNRGFFILTRNHEFYPNPNSHVICNDFKTHYRFIGRMLGKAIFENIVVEVTLADFFLAEILGFYDEFYVNGLASLDSDLYKNLISLTCYDGDLSDLGLDFTLILNDFGENKVVELKPDGKDIPVTEENVLEYVYLVAKFKVHSQIKEQASSFSEGLGSVVSLEWLRIFTAKELQIIISGNKCPIDIDDLKAHTVYTGGHTEDHPTIVMFWRVVKSLDNNQRSLLLKFVTSCSKPPLLGFKDLNPSFCIQLTDGDENRLPTSSTCMNMLKLPVFTNEDTMKNRLIYAIQSRSGFDLA